MMPDGNPYALPAKQFRRPTTVKGLLRCGQHAQNRPTGRSKVLTEIKGTRSTENTNVQWYAEESLVRSGFVYPLNGWRMKTFS